MARRDDPWRMVKTSEATFKLLEQVKRYGSRSVSDLTSEVDMARSTVHDHLRTLEICGLVVKTEDEYQLSLRLLEYGCAARDRIVDPEVVQRSIDQLAAETTETAWFSVEERGELVHLHKSMGDRALTLGDRIGNHHELHYYAAGKVIMAHRSEERIRELVSDHELGKHTDRTITNEAELLAELETIRQQGVAYNDGEFNEGTRGVAAPVLYEDTAIGSVAVHGPTNRLSGDYFDAELPQKVKACANEIELKLVQRDTETIFGERQP